MGGKIRWIGAVVGAVLGSARGGGIVGGLIGSLIGNWVEEKVRDYLNRPSSSAKQSHNQSIPDEILSSQSPYEVLGISSDATNEEIKQAYRDKVKHLHPDMLRSKDLPAEVMAAVNEQMARINAAWETIKRERRL